MAQPDVDRASRWLYGRRDALAARSRDGPSGGAEQLLDEALAGVDALRVVDVLDDIAAGWWRAELTRAATGQAITVQAPDDTKRAAADLLRELLDVLPDELDGDDPRFEHFEGAAELLGAIGAADQRAWDDRLRERMGEPSVEEEFAEVRRLNSGGTEVDLITVLAGPPERRKGHRLVAALCFTDGTTFLIDKEVAPEFDWPDWRAVDDVGTAYQPGSCSGSDREEHVTFRTPLPPEARWIELTHESDPEITFRVER